MIKIYSSDDSDLPVRYHPRSRCAPPEANSICSHLLAHTHTLTPIRSGETRQGTSWSGLRKLTFMIILAIHQMLRLGHYNLFLLSRAGRYKDLRWFGAIIRIPRSVGVIIYLPTRLSLQTRTKKNLAAQIWTARECFTNWSVHKELEVSHTNKVQKL